MTESASVIADDPPYKLVFVILSHFPVGLVEEPAPH